MLEALLGTRIEFEKMQSLNEKEWNYSKNASTQKHTHMHPYYKRRLVAHFKCNPTKLNRNFTFLLAVMRLLMTYASGNVIFLRTESVLALSPFHSFSRYYLKTYWFHSLRNEQNEKREKNINDKWNQQHTDKKKAGTTYTTKALCWSNQRIFIAQHFRIDNIYTHFSNDAWKRKAERENSRHIIYIVNLF